MLSLRQTLEVATPRSHVNEAETRVIKQRDSSLKLIAYVRALSGTLITSTTRLPRRSIDELHDDEGPGFRLADFVGRI